MNNELNGILNNFKKELIAIYKKNLKSLILYGSQARGDNIESSDIDVLILLNAEVNQIKELRKINRILSNLSLEFNQIISCMFMSKNRFDEEKSPLVLNIKREGIVL